ncbi:hypothetical protein LOTGIDRAFT_193800, partial [Lottia gigantea]
MPASVYSEMTTTSSALEDQRALQLAFELSMLALNGEDDTSSSPPLPNSTFDEAHMRARSANTTECVPVPSSEHVAEIVGRQGCKIKALRAKTNTYIKTPVRGEEPVFVVTGRKEDVGLAKREIVSAAEHFSQIRASRRNSSVSSVSSNGSNLTPGPPSPNAPGQITIQVRVPYRVVGLVVGPKGATIKRIQQQTHTYIVTPSRDKEPVFEVTGLPENVEKARHEIESHIALRTGDLVNGINGFSSYDNDEGISSPSYDPFVPPTTSPSLPESGTQSQGSGSPSNISPVPGDHPTVRRIRSDPLSNGLTNGTCITNGSCMNGLPTTFGSTSNLDRPSSTSPILDANGVVRPRRHCLICSENEVVAALVPCGHNLFCMDCASSIVGKPMAERSCPVCQQPPSQAIRILS